MVHISNLFACSDLFLANLHQPDKFHCLIKKEFYQNYYMFLGPGEMDQ